MVTHSQLAQAAAAIATAEMSDKRLILDSTCVLSAHKALHFVSLFWSALGWPFHSPIFARSSFVRPAWRSLHVRIDSNMKYDNQFKRPMTSQTIGSDQERTHVTGVVGGWERGGGGGGASGLPDMHTPTLEENLCIGLHPARVYVCSLYASAFSDSHTETHEVP